MLLLTSALLSAAYVLQQPTGFVHQRGAPARAAPCVATATMQEYATLGQVLSKPWPAGWETDELVVVDPVPRAQAKMGELVRFEGGSTGVLVMERCGLYFAAMLDGDAANSRQRVDQLGEQLAVQRAADAAWGGVYDHLGRPADQAVEHRGWPAGHRLLGWQI